MAQCPRSARTPVKSGGFSSEFPEIVTLSDCGPTPAFSVCVHPGGGGAAAPCRAQGCGDTPRGAAGFLVASDQHPGEPRAQGIAAPRPRARAPLVGTEPGLLPLRPGSDPSDCPRPVLGLHCALSPLRPVSAQAPLHAINVAFLLANPLPLTAAPRGARSGPGPRRRAGGPGREGLGARGPPPPPVRCCRPHRSGDLVWRSRRAGVSIPVDATLFWQLCLREADVSPRPWWPPTRRSPRTFPST